MIDSADSPEDLREPAEAEAVDLGGAPEAAEEENAADEEEPTRDEDELEDLAAAVELTLAELRAFAGRIIAALDLSGSDAAHQHLAEQAVWLVVMNQDEGLRVALEELLAGRAWDALFVSAAAAAQDDVAPRVRSPSLDRLALGLCLQQRASQKGPGAAQRTLAALAALALACADPDAGARLRRGFGRLDLLSITDQIPVAGRVRMLALEYRHMPPTGEPPSPGFVARVEDLLEQLDAQRLLPYSLDDLPGRQAGDATAALLEVLLPSGARSLRVMARLLLRTAEPFASLAELREACAKEAPDRWGLREPTLEEQELGRDYAELRATFADTPFALRDDGAFGRA